MLYADSETAWLDRRAAKIARERGWPLPIARSEACAELVRNRVSGRTARVIAFPSGAKTMSENGIDVIV